MILYSYYHKKRQSSVPARLGWRKIRNFVVTSKITYSSTSEEQIKRRLGTHATNTFYDTNAIKTS